jgi:hypothetical protein
MSLFKREINLINNNGGGIGKIIGKIDLLFKFKKKLYCGEIKWTIPRNDFWSALKVVGYCAYYNWQNETWGGFDAGFPAILIPKKHIKLEHKIVANNLKIALFGIIETKDGEYLLENVNPF